MADVLAAENLVFRRRGTLELVALDPELELGAGGEAIVYALPGDASLVAKLYREPGIARARKLALMMANPPALDPAVGSLAWPCDLLLEERGRFAGFLMPRAEGPRLFEFYNPVSRRQVAPRSHYGMLHRAGANLAAAFEALHAAGYVVGDVNESNLLIGPRGVVTLVDCDSFQVRDPDDGAVHRSHVGKAEFTPPELQGRPFAEFDRSPEHDRFGVAALLFLLLMEGTHPFALRMSSGAETPPIEERIRRGLFPFGGAHPECRPPRLAPRFKLLSPSLRALFLRAFVDGHADPAARPTAAEWRSALLAAADALTPCAENRRHRYGSHLASCPWCERREQLGGRDPFPGAGAPAAEDEELVLAPLAKAVVRRPARRAPLGRPTPRSVAAPPRPVASAAPAAAQGAAPAFSVLPQTPAWAASLPPWMQTAVGPTAFGNPLPWLAMLLWVAVFGDVGNALALVGFFGVFARMVLRGTGPVSWHTGMAAVALVIGGSLLTNHPSWAAGDDPYGYAFGGDTTVYGMATDGVVTTAGGAGGEPQVWFGSPYTLETVDAVPGLLNPVDAEALLEAAYPPALRDAGVTGGLLLNVRVREDGSVDPDAVNTLQASHPEFADAARKVAPQLRFAPLMVDGEATAGWVSVEIFFSL